ncbi:MAG: hypothetical protein ACI4WU_02200, partial [Bacilli bacterium]
MNQEIYNHVMEILNDLIIFKGYQIADKEEFCKTVAQRIPDDEAFSVVIGNMNEKIEDLIEEVYFGIDMGRKNDIDDSEFDKLLSIFTISEDESKKKVEFQDDDISEIIKAHLKLYGMSEKFGNDKEGLALDHIFVIANLSGYTFKKNDTGDRYSNIEYVARNILKIYFSEEQYDDII